MADSASTSDTCMLSDVYFLQLASLPIMISATFHKPVFPVQVIACVFCCVGGDESGWITLDLVKALLKYFAICRLGSNRSDVTDCSRQGYFPIIAVRDVECTYYLASEAAACASAASL